MKDNEIQLKRKERWEEFYSNVSIEGFQYLFAERGWKRVLWILLFIAALVLSVYLFFDVCMDYVEYKSYSSYETEQLQEMPFPTITICNMNSVLRSKVQKLGLNITPEEFRKYYEAFHPVLYNISTEDIQKVMDELERSNITSTEDLMAKTNGDISDMLDKNLPQITKYPCVLHGVECTKKYFLMTSSWMMFVSSCAQFNPYVKGKEPYKVSGGGFSNSFAMTANLNVNDMLYSPFKGQSLMILVHHYGTPAFLPEYAYTLFTVTGHMNVLSLVTKKIELLPAPYPSACGEKDLKILKGYPYSKAACEADCVLQKVYQKCGCVSYVLKDYVEDIPICNLTQHICYMIETRHQAAIRKCNCPAPCNSYTYEIQSSSVNIDEDTLTDKMMKKTDWNKTRAETKRFMKKNMIGLWIYFQNMVLKKEIVTPTVNFVDFIGNVGGNIGLCVGFSAITIFEVLDFIWDYVAIGRS